MDRPPGIVACKGQNMKHVTFLERHGAPQIVRRVSETAAEYAAAISRDPAGTGHAAVTVLSLVGLAGLVLLALLGVVQ